MAATAIDFNKHKHLYNPDKFPYIEPKFGEVNAESLFCKAPTVQARTLFNAFM